MSAGGPSPRRVAFDVLRQVTGEGAYANLALAKRLAQAGLDPRDAGLVTELVAGTCRMTGTYDRITEAAAGRGLSSMQPAVVDLLRLGAHQVLSMGVKRYAAVGTTVELARSTVGQRVTGLVNAVMRKIAARDMEGWLDQLAAEEDEVGELALRGHHPRWIVDAYARVLPRDELPAALAANNVAPTPTLVVRPGLADVADLVGAVPTRFSPYGATVPSAPADQEMVRHGRAGVQDEGSQLVALALARADSVAGPWLDMCAGPGGKAALLTGLARQADTWLLAGEAQEHRARLIASALAAYPDGYQVITADGTAPAWGRSFSRVMADVPCSGLGALRRRPDSRWRRTVDDVAGLADLQRSLLATAISSTLPGGLVAYVTCSPHRSETSDIVDAVLAGEPTVRRLRAWELLSEVPDAASGDDVQLWPHRHGTDAMYLALLRVG